MDEIKLAIIIRSFNRGGAEVLIRETLQNNLFKQSIKHFDLLILDSKRLRLLEDLEGINCIIFKLFSSAPITFLQEYKRLYKTLKANKYNLVHTHLPNAGILLRLLKPFLPKLKLIYTEHNIVDSYNKASFLFNGISYFKNDYTIFVSAEVKAAVDKHQKKFFYNYNKASVILNGVDADKFSCDSKQTKLSQKEFLTIGTVVSFRKWKRLDRWLEVAEAIVKNHAHIPVRFIIAGDGPEKTMTDNLVAQKNLSAYIQLPGTVINTVAVYNSIDIFLMTSEFEGLPVALLEAMACSCIPVVSNVGGIKHMSFEGFGYKYESFNANTIAQQIISYWGNEAKKFKEQNKAREYVINNNSLNKQVTDYLKIYKTVLQ